MHAKKYRRKYDTPILYQIWKIKANRKSSAVVLITAFNGSAVLIAESFGNGETEARIFFGPVGLIETIEDFSEDLGFNFCAVV